MKTWAVRIIGIDDTHNSVIDYVLGLYEDRHMAEIRANAYNSNFRGKDGVSKDSTAYVVRISYPTNAPTEEELKERMANYE